LVKHCETSDADRVRGHDHPQRVLALAGQLHRYMEAFQHLERNPVDEKDCVTRFEKLQAPAEPNPDDKIVIFVTCFDNHVVTSSESTEIVALRNTISQLEMTLVDDVEYNTSAEIMQAHWTAASTRILLQELWSALTYFHRMRKVDRISRHLQARFLI